jgi:hypothetical protein
MRIESLSYRVIESLKIDKDHFLGERPSSLQGIGIILALIASLLLGASSSP